MKWNKEERVAYGKIFRLALPIIIQNLFSAAISSADVIMLNSVGQSAISAASLAVQYSSILYMVYYGLGTGATMLCAQYWGKGDLHTIERVEGIALRFSILISLLFAVPAVGVPQLMMKVFTNDTELIELGILTKRAWEKNVQVMIEGPGHMSIDEIAAVMAADVH